MLAVVLGVDALAPWSAQGLSGGTAGCALTRLATTALVANFAATAAMSQVGLGVDALTIAQGCVLRAATLAFGAFLSRFASLATSATVLRVGLRVDTSACA